MKCRKIIRLHVILHHVFFVIIVVCDFMILVQNQRDSTAYNTLPSMHSNSLPLTDPVLPISPWWGFSVTYCLESVNQNMFIYNKQIRSIWCQTVVGLLVFPVSSQFLKCSRKFYNAVWKLPFSLLISIHVSSYLFTYSSYSARRR